MGEVTHEGAWFVSIPGHPEAMLYPPNGSEVKAPPEGRVIVHNAHARPAKMQGTRRFRFWYQAGAYPPMLPCDCGWASELGEHYRLSREGADVVERATRYFVW
jgi:hypothetical protein